MTGRTLLAAAGGAIALILAAALWLFLADDRGPISPAAIEIGGADIGGPFELTAHTGERVSSDTLIDGPTMLYFGYSFCPDVCPVDVAVMAEAIDLLAGMGHVVTPVFITVDPARDDPAALGQFVGAMHPAMIGLTGTADEIAAAAKAYKVFFAKAGPVDADTDYLMSHSNFFYLMTPGGLAGVFRPSFPPDDIARAAAAALGR